jgi:hypothetical protein
MSPVRSRSPAPFISRTNRVALHDHQTSPGLRSPPHNLTPRPIMALSCPVARLKLLPCRKSARAFGILATRLPGGFGFTARSLKWFQTRSRKPTVSRFTSLRKKTREFACYSFPRPSFRVCEAGSRTPPELPLCQEEIATPRVRPKILMRRIKIIHPSKRAVT